MGLVEDRNEAVRKGEIANRMFSRFQNGIDRNNSRRIKATNRLTIMIQVTGICLALISWMARESMVSAYVSRNSSFRSGIRRLEAWSLYSTATRSEIPLTLMTMKGTIDPRTVERQLLNFGRKGKLDHVQSLYFSLFDDQQQPKLGVQVRPSTKLMNVAIAACSSSVSTSLDIFNHGLNHHICPNVYTYGALLKSCAVSRNVTMALNLLHDMEHVHKIEPNAVIYSTVIKACEQQPNLAFEILKRGALSGQMGVVGYNAAISAMAKNGKWKIALSLLYQMKERNAKTSKQKTVQKQQQSNNTESFQGNMTECFVSDADNENDWITCLLMNQDNLRKNKKSQSIADIATDDILLPDEVRPPRPDQITYGTVMVACERGGQWEHVLTLAREAFSDDGESLLDGIGLCSALHASQQLGNVPAAIEYFERLKSVSELKDKDQSYNRRRKNQPFTQGPDAIAYHMIISACAKSKQYWLESIRYLREMKKILGYVDVQAYTSAIMGCAIAGEYGLAFDLLNEMESQEGIKPNAITYTAVMTACAKAAGSMENIQESKEPVKRALKLFQEIQHKDHGVEANIVMYNAAIRVHAEGRDLDGAFKLFDDLESRRLSPTVVTYGSLMTACERVGSMDGVNRVFRMMNKANSDVSPNEIVFGAAISCCRKTNEPERALFLIRKMIKDYQLSPNTATFNTALMALTEAGCKNEKYFDKAISLFKVMISKKLTIAVSGNERNANNESQMKNRPNRQTYNIMVRALASNKRPDDAFAFLVKMRQEGFTPDVDLYTATVTAFERCGKPRMALELMQTMEEDGYNFYEVKVLDNIFKKAIKLVNGVVGRKSKLDFKNQTLHGQSTEEETAYEMSEPQLQFEDSDTPLQ